MTSDPRKATSAEAEITYAAGEQPDAARHRGNAEQHGQHHAGNVGLQEAGEPQEGLHAGTRP